MFLLILVKKHTKKINFSLTLQSIICHFCDQKYFVIFASLFSLFLLSLRKRNQNARAVPKKLKNWYKSYSAFFASLKKLFTLGNWNKFHYSRLITILNSDQQNASSKICICPWLLYFDLGQNNLARNRHLRIYLNFFKRFLRNARLPCGIHVRFSEYGSKKTLHNKSHKTIGLWTEGDKWLIPDGNRALP